MSAHEVQRGPARLETEPDRVWFRTGNDVLPSLVFVIWDGGDRVAVSVTNEINDGMGVLITLDELARMHHAIGLILERSDNAFSARWSHPNAPVHNPVDGGNR